MSTSTTKSTGSSGKSRRVLPKEIRREQLIHATMKSIARNGLSGTTLAQVTREAGLSMGIANLHFESKDKLLVETLRYVTDEYNRGHIAILENATYQNTAERLEAIVQFDFSPAVTTRDKMAVWFAFWGEAKSRPTYQRICRSTDFRAEEAMSELLEAAITESADRQLDPTLIASGYTSLVDGLWLSMLLAPKHLSRARALRIARDYLAGYFPDHIRPENA